MKLQVDGRAVELPVGATVLDALRAAGAEVHSLCSDERISPAGSCRTCMVGVSGSAGAVAACTTAAADGMDVRSDDPMARAAVRTTLELFVSELPPRALDVPEDRSELVRACRAHGVETSRFEGARLEHPRDDSHPYVKFDPELCIACGRCVRMCDEVQGTFALELAGRGFPTVAAAGTGRRWIDSD